MPRPQFRERAGKQGLLAGGEAPATGSSWDCLSTLPTFPGLPC